MLVRGVVEGGEDDAWRITADFRFQVNIPKGGMAEREIKREK